MANLFRKAEENVQLFDQVQLYPLGEAALVLDAGKAAQAQLLQMQVAAQLRDDVLAAILGVGNLTFRFDPLKTDSTQLARELKSLFLNTQQSVADLPRVHELAVRYGGEDGPDLAFVAEQAKLSIIEVVQRHSAVTYDVLCIGFLPGFPYLAGLPSELACPRRASPRIQVPAGSVGIGGAQTGIYPTASPGGWQLIGRCLTTLFDETQSPPSLIQAGDRVRFVVESLQQ